MHDFFVCSKTHSRSVLADVWEQEAHYSLQAHSLFAAFSCDTEVRSSIMSDRLEEMFLEGAPEGLQMPVLKKSRSSGLIGLDFSVGLRVALLE